MERHIDGIFVDDGGHGGLPVVLVHASAGNTQQWSAQLPHLRAERRAIALDLRGHGRSALPRDGDYSIEALASDIARVVNRLELSRFVLAGHSLGAAVAVAYAGAHPERVAGLFLLDPATDGRFIPPAARQGIMQAMRSEAYLKTVEEYWAPMLRPSCSTVRERVLSDLRRTPECAVVESLESLLHFDPVTPLSRYRGPRLSVISETNETPAAYHRQLADIPYKKIRATGHWVQLDAPAEVNYTLGTFLTQVA